jgi:SAM-dependent methyltransferase
VDDANLHLVCPRDHTELELRDDTFVCGLGDEFPSVDGIPILVSNLEPTQPGYWSDPLAIERARAQPRVTREAVDPYVAKLLIGTHGNLYRGVDTIPHYPIPHFPAIDAPGRRMLDVGCNWGRWSIAAARNGYDVIGIDPSIEAIMAARRIAQQLREHITYVVADARRLPFPDASFDVVFSYSVLQHFPHDAVRTSVEEFGRVLAPGGIVYVQMANRRGVLNLWRLTQRRFREGRAFEVRYWRTSELRRVFCLVGDTTLLADGFFTLNPQAADLDLLPRRARAIVRASNRLRSFAAFAPPLALLADSLWVHARKA